MQLQTFLMCTYQQGKQLKKKQQQSTSNCQCNANEMPPGQKGRILWEPFFNAHQQGEQIKHKKQWCRANTMPPRQICMQENFLNIFDAHWQEKQIKNKQQQSTFDAVPMQC